MAGALGMVDDPVVETESIESPVSAMASGGWSAGER
jgi:hypothetical protein